MSIARPASRTRSARPARPPAALAALLTTLICLFALPTGGTAHAVGAEAPATAEAFLLWPAADDDGPRPQLAGGDPVFSSGGATCTVVANLRVGNAAFGLLPGSCTEGFPHWYADPGRTVPIGPTTSSRFPTHGTFGYENPDIPVEPTPNCGGTILTSAGNPTVGQAVMRGSRTTGCQSATVTGVNVTVNFGGGVVVTGLIQTNLCVEPGDPGGALTSGTTLVGIPVGGSGNCSSGGTSYYQPVVPVLNELGATLV
ncbi:S1 family peptidase [Streptomyces triticirhizae]|uniref:Serine protease n=1 Tax=Streptomyces triticirhizae TaxID=2483353 RepID=A0A3M2KR84_9ACTN|nr:S1 family peptidase [Streptomyces triticirhizae]RMI27534.1 serine protease [Streptomyces triticirhizae]